MSESDRQTAAHVAQNGQKCNTQNEEESIMQKLMSKPKYLEIKDRYSSYIL